MSEEATVLGLGCWQWSVVTEGTLLMVEIVAAAVAAAGNSAYSAGGMPVEGSPCMSLDHCLLCTAYEDLGAQTGQMQKSDC